LPGYSLSGLEYADKRYSHIKLKYMQNKELCCNKIDFVKSKMLQASHESYGKAHLISIYHVTTFQFRL
jgi:hypothetical protein